MAASFYKKKVMSKSEYKVFKIVETEVQAQRNGCRVLSQTSLGEIIGSDNEKAFASSQQQARRYPDHGAIWRSRSLRSNIRAAAIIKAARQPATRSRERRLRKAGVQFLEIAENHTAEEIAQLVRKLFQQSEPAQSRT